MNVKNLQPKKFFLLLASLVLLSTESVNAQLIPSTAYENVFPAGVPVGNVPSCYSFGNINFGGALVYDTYLSAVDGQLNWRLTKPGLPWSIINSGTISYPNCRDINVGMNYTSGGGVIAIVAYHKAGSGHYYDIYKWTPMGLGLISTTALSTLPNYTRISMDSHKTYGTAITWEDPMGIFTVVGLNGVFTSPIYFIGSQGMERPDVAFSHSNVGLNLHYVYDTPNGMPGYDIYEVEADFWVLNGWVGPYTPAVMDVNPVACNWSQMTASIDAPDHYSVDNWAYTYAVDGADVFVRSMDFNTSTINTTNLVDGTLGNSPMFAKELRPRIAYDKHNNTYHVGWYSSWGVWPVGQCYFAEEIWEDGTVMVSPNDYELVAANSNFPPGASLNSIAFSKQNDASPFQFGVFLDNSGIHNTFHVWGSSSSWRGGEDLVTNSIMDDCSNHTNKVTGIHNHEASGTEFAIGPNPFSASLKLRVPASVKDQNMFLCVCDVTGKVLLQYEGIASDASSAVEQAARNFSAGTYFVKTKITSTGSQQNFKLIKTASTN